MNKTNREFKILFKEVNGVATIDNDIKGTVSMPEVAAILCASLEQFKDPIQVLEYTSRALHLKAQQLVADKVKEKNGL